MNLQRFAKEDIIKMATTRCKHRHTFLEHPDCWEKPKERLGFLDIEASNLDADFGIIISYCIKHYHGRIISNIITPEELRAGELDKRLMGDLIVDLRKFDRIVTYYGTGFDVPFMRTRAMHYDLNFPLYKEVKHTDVYYWVKMKMRLHRNRLQNACDFLGISAKGHPMLPNQWTLAQTGNKKALQYILVHNKEDVCSLEELYDRLLDFTANRATTI